MHARISAVFVAFALAVTGLASAQERFGTITGTVKDQQGLVLPGVTVTVTNNETRRQTVVATDSDGVYFARSLEPGRYTVKFELSSFAPQEAPDVLVRPAETAPVDVSMRVGALTETVQVLAETPLIDPGQTTRQRSIPAEQFEIIP